MGTTILHAKTTIPPLPASYMRRLRLDRQWEGWSGKHLLLVTAGAGFGKTSFLAANVREGKRPCLWLSLDGQDTEPASFFLHLAEAVRPICEDLRIETAAGEHDPSSLFLTDLLRALRESGRGALLVLDDVQYLAGRSESLHFLDRLVRFIPDGCTVVLSAREPIGIQTARLRTHGSLAALGAQELRFTEEEVGGLLRHRFPRLSFGPDLTRRVVGVTEGWAAGIEILFQASDGRSAAAIRETLDRIGSAGSGWFSYFAEEVVSRLDPQTQDFLLRSSVLPRLDPVLCDEVLLVQNSRAILEELTRRNLFTFSTGGRGAFFRYHHLFREFLRDQLELESPAKLKSLRLRAAAALARAGAWADAAAVYAEAGDPGSTLRVIEKFGDRLLEAGHYSVLRRTIESIPPAVLVSNAAALTVLGRLQEIRGEWREAQVTYQNALRARPPATRRAELIRLLAAIHIRLGEYDACERLCRAALARRGSRNPRLRGTLLCLLGLSSAELGRLQEAERNLREAQALFHRIQDRTWEGRTLFLQAVNVHYYRGEFQKAKDQARQALVVFQEQTNQHGICHTMAILGFLAAADADEGSARELTEAAQRMAEGLEYRFVEGICHLALGRCALLASEPRTAHEHFVRAHDLGDELREYSLRTMSGLGLIEVALAEGNRHRARLAAAETLKILLSRKDRFPEAQCYMLMALAEAQAHPQKAKAWWRKAETILRRMGATFEVHRLLLYRLDARDVPAKQRRKSIVELVTGVARSAHDLLFLRLEPDRAARVLSEALLLEIETDYVAGLLVRLGSCCVPHLAPLVDEAPEEVRRRVVEILARIGGEEARVVLSRLAAATTKVGRAALRVAAELEHAPAVPLKIQALGAFRLFAGERPLLVERLRCGRPLSLLQFLLVQRFRWVTKEAILEAFWPEAEPQKADNCLRQYVHVLRRTLEPDLEVPRLSRYVRFLNGAYRLDPGRAYFYDVEAFARALQEGLRHWDAGNRKKAEATLRTAVDLYGGSFLEENPYEEFAAAEREKLRDRFLRGLGRLLDLCAAGGRWEALVPLARRGLSEDPYNEDFHWYLIQAHLKLRSRHEALAAYHRYEAVMTGELNLLPSARLKALAEQAVALGGGSRDAVRSRP